MSQGWPTRQQAAFLAHAVTVYRVTFMGPYNLIVGSVTRREFWDRVMEVYFEHFPVESMSAKDVATREVVSTALLQVTM
jgi:hypothetical protein